MLQTNEYAYISTNTTTVVCPKASVLHSIIVGTTAAGAIKIYDDAVQVGELKSNIVEGTYIFDIAIKGALSIETAASSKITVAYRPS